MPIGRFTGTPVAPVPEPPIMTAWLGLLGSGLAALAGGQSGQAYGLARGDLGGALGLSANQASWIVTVGNMAEGAAVLIAAPLTAAFGVRRVVSAAALAGGACAFAALQTSSPTLVRVARALGGFASACCPS